MLGPIVGPHEEIEVTGKREEIEAAHGRLVPLRGDDAKRKSGVLQAVEHIPRVGEHLDQVVVDQGVVLAVHAAKLVMHRLVIGEIPHLNDKRLPHFGHELLVGQRFAQHFPRGVAKGGQQQVVGVQQRSVQVEQNGLY